MDDAAFADEQARLAGVWTFLGLTSDLARDGAWITGQIGGRPVFVQRFGETLRGFLNVCAHRGFPLREGEAGCGPVVCGFHHWRYDADGSLVGAPVAQDVFGRRTEDLQAHLEPVDVACCGALVFGRFAETADGLAAGLEASLGAAFPILETICQLSDAPAVHGYGRPVAANWKLMVAITLDDYHTPAIHGRERYLRRSEFDYWRFGAHSAHSAGQEDSLASVAQACASGDYHPKFYKLFNIFPNLAVTLFKAGPYWYVLVQQFDAEGPARTRWRARYFRTPWRRLAEPLFAPQAPRLTDRIVAWFIRREAGKITEEDHVACERWQASARHLPPPLERLSTHEERLGWFCESWRRSQTGETPP